MVALSIILLGILSLILLSPFLLGEIENIRKENWQQLGNIGQAYDAPSAILGGIALLGVVASLIVQTRQARTERIQIVRERHMELLKMTIEDPHTYGPIVGRDPGLNVDSFRRFLFTTMWINYARMGYQMDVLTEKTLKSDLFQGLFSSDAGRSWWSDAREIWLDSPVPERRARKFAEMMESEYQKALASGPPSINTADTNSALPPSAAERTRNHPGMKYAICSSIIAGYVTGRYIHRNR